MRPETIIRLREKYLEECYRLQHPKRAKQEARGRAIRLYLFLGVYFIIGTIIFILLLSFAC